MIPAGKRAHKAFFLLLSLVLVMSILLSGCSFFEGKWGEKHDYKVVTSSRELFNELYDALYRFEDNVYVQTGSEEEFDTYWNDLVRQSAIHYAFREKNIKMSILERSGSYRVKMQMQLNACGQAMQYLYTKKVSDYPSDAARKVGEKLLSIKNSIIKGDMTDLEKVKAIHDYLVCNCAYALDRDVSQYSTADVLLDEGLAQCQGYSETFTALCLLCGIESRVICGTSTFGFGDGGHAWNQVFVDAFWYHVDVTWDDPIPDQPGLISYDYFLKSDAMMKTTHQWCPYFEECYLDHV